MRRFFITSPKFTGTAELLYNAEGTLVKVDMLQAQMNEDTVLAFKRMVPHNIATLEANQWCSPGTIVAEANYEISFDDFWAAYDLKVNRKRCIPLWNKLPKTLQIAAYQGVAKYLRHLKNTGQYKRNPENYLKDEMWNNEYK